ncbi:MAG: hypothetical protein J5730_07170 [Bacteroidales bacterium]|nr:hypothetical protein [Bacteroidales bacterium]
MKKLILSTVLLLMFCVGFAQTQPMKFMGISLNCTMSTFTSKLKGKGFVPEANGSRDNFMVMKGLFAGEKVRLEVTCAAKTHMVSSVFVCFNRSTSYTYESLKKMLSEKYGSDYQEYTGLKEEGGYVKYVTDYAEWKNATDTVTGDCNRVVLSKCSYRSTSSYVISYLDGKNSKTEAAEKFSDF